MRIFNSLAMASPPGGESGGSLQFVGTMVLMMAVFYVMLIRPQRRKERERRELLAAVKSGDRVMFGGGMLGTVTNVKEKTIVIKIADKVKVEATRGAVTHVLEEGEFPEDDPHA